MPSVNEYIHSGTCPGISKKLHSHMHKTKSTVSMAPSDCSMVSSTKSEDSGYENGEFQQHCHFNLKQGIETCQNVTSSSSSSYSPAPKSSSSCSRVGSAFSDSPLESEEPVSLGTDLHANRNDHSLHSPSLQTRIEEDGIYSNGVSAS